MIDRLRTTWSISRHWCRSAAVGRGSGCLFVIMQQYRPSLILWYIYNKLCWSFRSFADPSDSDLINDWRCAIQSNGNSSTEFRRWLCMNIISPSKKKITKKKKVKMKRAASFNTSNPFRCRENSAPLQIKCPHADDLHQWSWTGRINYNQGPDPLLYWSFVMIWSIAACLLAW
jgi:hypothetical protein